MALCLISFLRGFQGRFLTTTSKRWLSISCLGVYRLGDDSLSSGFWRGINSPLPHLRKLQQRSFRFSRLLHACCEIPRILVSYFKLPLDFFLLSFFCLAGSFLYCVVSSHGMEDWSTVVEFFLLSTSTSFKSKLRSDLPLDLALDSDQWRENAGESSVKTGNLPPPHTLDSHLQVYWLIFHETRRYILYPQR